jgi:hypothetical protein
MPRPPLIFPIRLFACAILVALTGCASSATKLSFPPILPTPVAHTDSNAIGLVGLLVEKPWVGPPRAPGMTGSIVGYVIRHPALPTELFVAHRGDGHPLPVLAFKLTFVIVKEEGSQGPEEIRGRGTLRLFYNPDGFNETVLYYGGALENAQEIESDHIEFYANPDSGSDRLYRHIRETTIATHAFEFGGRPWRTPEPRTASDLLVGQYSDSFAGEVYVSSSALRTQSPEENLVGLVGMPNRKVRY